MWIPASITYNFYDSLLASSLKGAWRLTWDKLAQNGNGDQRIDEAFSAKLRFPNGGVGRTLWLRGHAG